MKLENEKTSKLLFYTTCLLRIQNAANKHFFAEIQNKMVFEQKDELGKHDAYIYREREVYTHVLRRRSSKTRH